MKTDIRATDDAPAPQSLAELSAEVRALRERVARHERRAARPRPRARLLAAFCAALLAALVPLSLLGANPFTDLVPGSPHNGNIDLIYAAGITRGCVADQQYCPTANVTREEMATFLARTAGLGGNKPVANAATLSGKAANELVRLGGAERATAQPLTADFDDYLTVQITSPGVGYVLVTGTVAIADLNDGCDGCDLEARLRHVQGNAYSPILGEDIASDELSFANTYVFPVGVGPQTFQLELRKDDPGGNVNALRGTITALYVPFGGGGLLPIPTGQP
jgi:hypothetical protein